jgi:hypothetical protein
MKRPTLLAIVGVVSLAAMAPSCADKKSTAITVAISSEAKVPDGVKYVEITVTRKGEIKLQNRYEVQADHSIHLPGTLAVVNDDDQDPTTPISVKIEAAIASGKGVDKKVIRSATLGFSEEKQKVLRMPIRFSCADFTCPSGKTCKAGRCEDEAVNAEALDDFDVETVIPVTGKCFSKDACLAAGGEKIVIPIETIVDALRDDCTLPYLFDADAELLAIKDTTDPKLAAMRDNVNMGFLWSGEYNITNAKASADVPPVWTVVDNDEDEGWQFSDVYKANKDKTLTGDDLMHRVSLTPGLCQAVKSDRDAIIAARAKVPTGGTYTRPATKLLGALEVRGCAPKTPNMPQCEDGQQGTTGK